MVISAKPALEQEISIHKMEQRHLPEADCIMRLAFGTFIGLPEPMAFMGDAQYVRTRWEADPDAAFVAEYGGEVIGSNFASNWGSVGFFGPLTVRPDFWDRGVGKLLMQPVDECFERWGTRHAGLFTFAQSAKHVGLYQRFGFWPRFLTAIMSKGVENQTTHPHWKTFSELSATDESTALEDCRKLTDEIYVGLDLTNEIRAVKNHALGDTVMLWDDSKLLAFAVCHMGADTEAGSKTMYIKFAASDSGKNFDRLLGTCNALALTLGIERIVAGVSLARVEAYQKMLTFGFRTEMQGVAMHRPNEAGYNRPDVYVIDDWR